MVHNCANKENMSVTEAQQTCACEEMAKMSAEVNRFEKAPRRLTGQEEACGLGIESTLGQMAYCSTLYSRPWQNPWYNLPCPRVKIGQ